MLKRFFFPIVLLALAACGDGPTGSSSRTPAAVKITSGDAQTAKVGAALANPLTVRVENAQGQPVAGYPVAFRVLSGGGSLDAAGGVTATDGTASTHWTLGLSTGTQQVEARVSDPAGAVLAADTFTAVASASDAFTITPLGSATRTGTAGLAVDSLVVRVTDRFGNPVPGQPLAWTVVSGGGTVTGTATTDAGGIGRGAWTLGAQVGTAQVVRVFAGVSLSTDFSAVATVPLGTVLTVVSGNGQGGTVGQALADSLVVRVTLPDGRPAAGVDVQWQPGAGSGSVSPGAQRTGADGRAATRWTLGTGAGTQTVTVLAIGAPSVTFVATAQPGAAATMTVVSGSGQSAPPGQPLPAPLVVQLRDAYGNPAPGRTVQWEVLSGGGSVSPPSSVTDAAGRAETGWTLGAAGAAGSVRASSTGVDPVTFTSPGSPVPSRVVVFSGDGQSAPAGSALANPVVARVEDAGGNPLRGVTVQWVVVSGRGQVAAQSITDASGLAYTRWTVGPELGIAETVEARVSGVATPATFNATTTAATIVLAKVAGDGQSANEGVAVAMNPAVRVTLPDGRGVLGVPVAWSTAPSDGSVTPTSNVTDSAGRAQAAWTLGHAAVAQVLTATAGGKTVKFTATAVPLLTIVSGNNQSGTMHTAAPESLVVRMARADGTPIPGVTISWVRGSGTGNAVVSPTTSITDAQGRAATSYRFGDVGATTVQARAPLAYDYASAYFTVTALTNAVLQKVSGDNQTAKAGQTLPAPIRVRVVSPEGRPAVGVFVGFECGCTPGTGTTDADGYASATWKLGPYTVGTQKAVITSNATSATLTFTATATP